jgi:D-sedoheptulose 7-phosphate isomerase
MNPPFPSIDPAIEPLFEQHLETCRRTRTALIEPLSRAASRLATTLAAGRKILICGNGGSAADAQHFSAELLNRFESERQPLPAIALTTDSSTLTSIANDYAYEEVFAKPVRALGQPGDALIALSTSGKSANVNTAVRVAQEKGLGVIALTGRDGGVLASLLRPEDIELRVPDASTARIQEMHILILHAFCAVIDRHLAAG